MSSALDHSATSAMLKYTFNSRSVTLSCKENLEIDIKHVSKRVQMVHIYLRNKSWKPECVGSFNMDWRILVFYPEPEARVTIY